MNIRKGISLCALSLGVFIGGVQAQPVSPAVTWTIFDDDGVNPAFRRSLIEDSVQPNGEGIAYIWKLEMVYPRGSVTTIERGVVADCTNRRRFEILNQMDWTTKPFTPVYPNTPNGNELDFVCNLHLAPSLQFALKRFPIPAPMAESDTNITD